MASWPDAASISQSLLPLISVNPKEGEARHAPEFGVLHYVLEEESAFPTGYGVPVISH